MKKPYPYIGDFRGSMISNFCIGLFVALFLIVFQPFGTNLWQTDLKLLKLAGFGLISFIVPTGIVFFIYKTPFGIKEEKWTVGSEILVILLILSLIALGNMLFGNLLGIASLSFGNYFSALAVTLLIGIFPVTFHVVNKHNKMLKRHLYQSSLLNNQLEKHLNGETTSINTAGNTIRLLAENEKDAFSVSEDRLLYIESADNYSNIYYLENSVLKKFLIRSSLKRIEGQIMPGNILRCHRTFIVNLSRVTKVEGNAAGYRLSLKDSDEAVPVSRNFVPLINEKLKGLL